MMIEGMGDFARDDGRKAQAQLILYTYIYIYTHIHMHIHIHVVFVYICICFSNRKVELALKPGMATSRPPPCSSKTDLLGGERHRQRGF